MAQEEMKDRDNGRHKPRNLTNAIAALRTRSWAMHQANKPLILQARLDVEAQQPYVAQVQQALMGNTEGKTIANVTPHWVNQRFTSFTASTVVVACEVGSDSITLVTESVNETNDYQYLRGCDASLLM